MKMINRISIIMSLASLGLLAGNIFMLSDIKSAIESGAAIQERMGATVAAFLIIIGLAHIVGLFTLVAQFHHFKEDNLVRAIAFVVGFLSLFLLAADVMMLSDIGHEYKVGFDTSGEWQIVFAGHAVHILFTVLLLIQCAASNAALAKNTGTIIAKKDEALFLTVNQIGIISAVLGFVCLFLLTWSGVSQSYLNGLFFMICIIFLIPYGLAAAYWFFTKRKEKPIDWYDEKQFSDISRGALATLLLTVFITIVFYSFLSLKIVVINTQLWFPLYLLLTLLLFSGSTLYLSKRA